jgi:competence protein ComEC
MERAPHQPLFAQSPLVCLAVSFSAGVVIAHVINLPFGPLLIGCALLSSASVPALIIKQPQTIAATCLCSAVLLSGAVLTTLEKKDIPDNRLKRLLEQGSIGVGEPVEVTGVINGNVDYALDGIYFTLRVEQVRYSSVDMRASGSLALMAGFQSETARNEYEELELRHGARLRMMTTLRREDSFRNPGVALFTEYLDRKGYDAKSFIKSPSLIERLDDERVFLPLALLYEWRKRLQREIDKQFSLHTAGVLDAALLGNRYNLLPSTAERFRDGGTFHVLVISGLHITFIGGVVFIITNRLTKRRGLRFILSAVVLWGYALAVGAEASVVRAALMFTLVALGPVVFRRTSSLNALGGAAVLLLVWRPQNLFDPSFQLTFLSVLAIVALAWPLMHTLSAVGLWRPTRESPYPPACPRWLREFSELLFWSERKWKKEMARSVYTCRLFKNPAAARLERCRLQRLTRYVLAAIVVSASVQTVLIPFLVIYFHRLSIASLLLNIGVSLMMAGLAVASLAALLVAQFSAAAAAPLTSLANGLNWLMVHSVDPFSQFGLASTRLPHYSGAAATVYGLYYLPLVVLVTALHRWNPLVPKPESSGSVNKTVIAAVGQLFLLALIILHPLSAGRANGKLQIDFLDVGQGDSALVTMPDGTTLLVDGGGRPNFSRAISETGGEEDDQLAREKRPVGEVVVSEYLWWRGLDSIDYILATHADADHIDGLNDVARNFRVRAALVARAPGFDLEFQKFARTLLRRNVPLSLIGAGDVLRFGSINAKVLWPPASNNLKAPSRNNDSVVLRLEMGGNAIFLTGDIENGAEQAILKAGENLRVNVLKVPHHGSKTSSTQLFVTETNPSVAVISVGQTSIFGHPNPEVVERWTAGGAAVLTTVRSGTITITMDERDVSVRTFVRE